MQRLDGELILSATDLTGFAVCRHLTRLELAAASGALERPSREDPMLDVLGRKGDEHEAAYLARLRAEGRSVVEITNDSFTRAELVAAEAATLAAMRDGVDVIYQATFFDGRWRGHADFLFKVDTPSALGHHSYEVADAKLAVRVKAAAIVQMCSYSEHVERLQGRAPEHIHVLTGDGEQHSHLLRDAARVLPVAEGALRGARRGRRRDHLPRSRGSLRHLPLERRLHRTPPHRRSPLARVGDAT